MSASSNQFGRLFQWTSFGESHGPAMGVVIDGCPAGVEFDETLLLDNLSRRRPGQKGATDRQESDQPEILSGLFEGRTLGTPIAVLVRNKDQRSQDYDSVQKEPRIGHADDVWKNKFGHSDHRGGGRSSARETLNWVIAGSFAQMFLKKNHPDLFVKAHLVQVDGVEVKGDEDPELLTKLEEAKQQGESFGAVIEARVQNMIPHLGEPIFGKLKAEMTRAYMTINATTSVEVGAGLALTKMRGTQAHTKKENEIYGGQRGGLSTGEDLSFRIGFKPTASIANVAKRGRHDPCVARRAVPIVEAMTWNVIADLSLAQRLNF